MTRRRRDVVIADQAPKAIGPYSLGIRTAEYVFTSGTLGVDPKTGELAPGGVESQTRQALENLANILESGGSSLQKVVKTTVFMGDFSEFSRMNEVYGEFFHSDPPARSTVQVAALPLGAAVQIEAVAVVEASMGGD
jgi:2-iminobutanoate/2-iminopropanoate deaminase